MSAASQHDRLEADRRLRIRIGRASVLGDAERLERANEIAVLPARYHADETTEAKPGLECVGTGECRAEQNQKAVEETVVLTRCGSAANSARLPETSWPSIDRTGSVAYLLFWWRILV
jgi:hypothetical protein